MPVKYEKVCPRCGREWSSTFNTCQKCPGVALELRDVAGNLKICPKCGREWCGRESPSALTDSWMGAGGCYVGDEEDQRAGRLKRYYRRVSSGSVAGGYPAAGECGEGSVLKYKIRYRLICGGDAKALGIEKENGSWNIDQLSDHIKVCKECLRFAAICSAQMSDVLEKNE